MATGAVRLVAATVESLYVSQPPGTDCAHLGRGARRHRHRRAGVGGLRGVAPAWEASRVTPVEAMARGRREHDVRMHRYRDLALGAALAMAAWMASRQPPVGGKPLFGYLAALL